MRSGQPGGRGRLKNGRLLDAEDDGHVGAFLHERVGAGEGHVADHRVGKEPRQHVAAEAELLFQLPLQLLVLGLDGEKPQQTSAPLRGKIEQLVERLHGIELEEVLIGRHQPRDLGHFGLDLIAGAFLFEEVLIRQRGQLGRRQIADGNVQIARPARSGQGRSLQGGLDGRGTGEDLVGV